MPPATHEFAFSGQLLQRGFWLYVWEIRPQDAEPLYYVGRTGDSSSFNAQSPFNRMGAHLGFNTNSNVLRRRLQTLAIAPEECTFRLIAHGPILPEAMTRVRHRESRDVVATMEKALAKEMCAAGYNVINRVDCRKPLDEPAFTAVRAGFREHFARLA
jgi:hypothetical protein